MEGAIALSALLFCQSCRMNNNDVLLSISYKHFREGSAVLDDEAVSLKRNEPKGETRCLHAALVQTRALAAEFLSCSVVNLEDTGCSFSLTSTNVKGTFWLRD